MTGPADQAGGGWLLERPDGIFTSEQATDEHRLIGQTAARFAESEVLPALEALEHKQWDVARGLFRRCGELDLFGVHVPDAYGGVGLDTVSSLIVSDRIARSASFATAFGAQANLAVLPIAMFGTDDQKARYLPRLVSGEHVGAYALSEAGSGSDALSIRTRADRQGDGSFRLSGEKMWITNGGFADVMIVFAKIAGEHFSAFIVERAFGGVSSGREERKMGLEGSSTTPLVLDGVPVPASNLLGMEGRGHKAGILGTELRTVEARRHVPRRMSLRNWRVRSLRRGAPAIRAADRDIRRDQAQAGRHDRAGVRPGSDGLSHCAPDRRPGHPA